MSVDCFASETVTNNSATLQYRSISQSGLRPKYYTINQQHTEGTICYQTKDKILRNRKHLAFHYEEIESLDFSSTKTSKNTNLDQSGTRKETFILPDLLCPCPVRLLNVPSFLISHLSQHQQIALSIDRRPRHSASSFFTLCKVEVCTKDGESSQESSQSVNPLGTQIVCPQKPLSRYLQSFLSFEHRQA